jgi:hypothetical protein
MRVSPLRRQSAWPFDFAQGRDDRVWVGWGESKPGAEARLRMEVSRGVWLDVPHSCAKARMNGPPGLWCRATFG